MICSQWIELDAFSHMCNIVNSCTFTRDIDSICCICHAQVNNSKDNEGGAVTTE